MVGFHDFERFEVFVYVSTYLVFKVKVSKRLAREGERVDESIRGFKKSGRGEERTRREECVASQMEFTGIYVVDILIK